MSYTKRYYEKFFNQLDNQIEMYYQNLQEHWYEPKHTDEPYPEEPDGDEDYYRELEDTRFVEDLNDYWAMRYEE